MKTVVYNGIKYRLNRYMYVWRVPASGSLKQTELQSVSREESQIVFDRARELGLHVKGYKGKQPYYNVADLPDDFTPTRKDNAAP